MTDDYVRIWKMITLRYLAQRNDIHVDLFLLQLLGHLHQILREVRHRRSDEHYDPHLMVLPLSVFESKMGDLDASSEVGFASRLKVVKFRQYTADV